MAITETLTVYPGNYDTTDYSYKSTGGISGATNPVGKGSSNTTYATINLATGLSAETWTFWPFDLSSIPVNATIDSVACSAKARISSTSTSYVTTYNVQLYSGSNSKGTAKALTTTATVHSISAGSWTRDELNNCRLRVYAKRAGYNGSTSVNIRFYGADLTVTYTYQNEKFMLKLGADDSWIDAQKVYKKDASGNWVEQTELSQVIDSNVRYKYGGHIAGDESIDTPETATYTITITGTGDKSLSYVVINGTPYYSASTLQVNDGDVITAFAEAGNSWSSCIIRVNGTTVGSGDSGKYEHTVTQDCTIALSVYSEGVENYGIIDITTESNVTPAL